MMEVTILVEPQIQSPNQSIFSHMSPYSVYIQPLKSVTAANGKKIRNILRIQSEQNHKSEQNQIAPVGQKYLY